jgi:hypothetical protein
MTDTLDLAALRRAATEAGVVISLAHALDFDGWDLPGVPEELVAHIAAFDPPTVLALLDRLDAAEARVAQVEELLPTWTEATCQTDGAPCSWHRVAAECAAEVRTELGEVRPSPAQRLVAALAAEEARLATEETPDPWAVPMLGNYLGGMKYALSVVRGEA